MFVNIYCQKHLIDNQTLCFLMGREEDTYTEIFSALKHPIRRKILKMLEVDNHTYTSLLNGLGIESGLLTYHLENLGSLIGKTDDGKYRVSEFGLAALKLTKNIEDPIKSTDEIRLVGLKIPKIVFWKTAVAILLIISVYTMYQYSIDIENDEYGYKWHVGTELDGYVLSNVYKRGSEKIVVISSPTDKTKTDRSIGSDVHLTSVEILIIGIDSGYDYIRYKIINEDGF